MLVLIMSLRLIAILLSLAWVPVVVISVVARGARDCACAESKQVELPKLPPIPADDDAYLRVTAHPRTQQEFERFCAMRGIAVGGKDIRMSLSVLDGKSPQKASGGT